LSFGAFAGIFVSLDELNPYIFIHGSSPKELVDDGDSRVQGFKDSRIRVKGLKLQRNKGLAKVPSAMFTNLYDTCKIPEG
jgi:hypothetical protein